LGFKRQAREARHKNPLKESGFRLLGKVNKMRIVKMAFYWSGLGGLMLALAGGGCRCPQQAAKAGATAPPTKEWQVAITPEKALAELKAGNARFVAGQPLARNYRADVKATESGQYPIAAVLSCMDSRAPMETVLDQGIGGIFSVRVAGNVLNDDALGSLEYACKVAGAKLIVVIGHSHCGAVKGAVDKVEMGSLTGLLARIKPAVDSVPDDGKPRNSKNGEFVEKAAEANVRLVMQQIRERSPILREMLDKGQIGLAGGMYDLETGRVTFY
jgi:carbonic anhydrase